MLELLAQLVEARLVGLVGAVSLAAFLGEWERAVQRFRVALEHRESAPVRYNLAISLARMGRLVEAIAEPYNTAIHDLCYVFLDGITAVLDEEWRSWNRVAA